MTVENQHEAGETGSSRATSPPSEPIKGPPDGTSSAQVAPPARGSATRVSPSRGAASPAAVPSGLNSRISSLSATAGASLRDMMAGSGVAGGSVGSVKTENGPGGTKGTEAVPAVRVTPEPSDQSGVAGTEEGRFTDVAVKKESSVKQEPLDSPQVTTVEAAAGGVPNTSLKTHESGAFTPTAGSFVPEETLRGYQASASAASMRGSSAASGRGVRIVKEELPPGGRRSSSYLYNDWDRTIYEKTGRPPPGSAHWSRDRSAPHERSPSRPGGAERSRTSSRPPTRSTSARRQRGRSRQATSPGGRPPFDMAGCWRQTHDQFGRRIIYRHCFIEPEFTLRGQRIPVHGARKGSIIAAEDTYALYALELVTPPTETQLWAQKVQRRTRTRKKRRRRRRRRRSLSDKNAKAECMLIEEQWQRLEEEGEKLEEDRVRLEETRQHLYQLEKWWQTEGLLILQRDELRTQEESIINAAIEEECLRINEERSRIREEWQLLLDRISRQEREESRLQEELDTLNEKQEQLNQREEVDMRRINEMKAVFEIERQMMEVDRKKLANDALTSDAFQDALKDAELGGWGPPSGEAHRGADVGSSARGEPAQADISDPFVNIKDSRVARLLADVIQPQPPPEPFQRHLQPAETEPDWRPPEPPAQPSLGDKQQRYPLPTDGGSPLLVDGDPAGARPPRPVTARGRPVKPSRSLPSGDAMERQTGRPLTAARSEGAGQTVAATETPGTGVSELVDVWRRRPTIMQRNDASSTVLVAGRHQYEGSRRRSSMGVPAIELTMSDESVRDAGLEAAAESRREPAKNKGVPHDANKAETGSGRRRDITMAQPETQETPATTSPMDDKTVTPSADASKHTKTERTGSTVTLPSNSEKTSTTLAALLANSQPPSNQADGFVGAPDVGVAAGKASCSPLVERQSSPLRGGLRSGEAGRRRVSFHEKTPIRIDDAEEAPVQTRSDGDETPVQRRSEGEGAEDVDVGDTGPVGRRLTASEVKREEAEVSDVDDAKLQ